MNSKRRATVLDLERYVPGLLVFLSNKLASGASTVYRRLFGIGITEWRVISMLAVEPNITAQRICQVIGLDKAIVSRTIRTLEEQSYVSAHPDKTHGRRITLALTAKGWHLHDEVYKVAIERERILLGDLSDAERERLILLLRNLLNRVGHVNAYAPDGNSKASVGSRRKQPK
jgi:DNA-binding MarR family transcriptional regulator